jgi:hypothetical protein
VMMVMVMMMMMMMMMMMTRVTKKKFPKRFKFEIICCVFKMIKKLLKCVKGLFSYLL